MPDLIESHVWRSIIESADGSTEVIETLIEGPGGADGTPGPNTVSDSTTVGTLTSAAADAASVLSTNAAGNAVRRIPLGATGRSLLGLVDAAAGRTLLGLGTAATQASTAFAAASHTHPLSAITQSGATTGQVASWNGSAWAPATVSGGGGGTWGSITGTLSSQTDLQTALDAKANTSSLGTLATLDAAPAGTLTGSTLAAGVTTSSLTSVGTLGSLAVSGALTAGTVNGVTMSGSSAAVRIGDSATASASASTAVGGAASASGLYATALGGQAAASGAYSLAMMFGASATQLRSIAIGFGAASSVASTVAIGTGAFTVASGDVALRGTSTSGGGSRVLVQGSASDGTSRSLAAITTVWTDSADGTRLAEVSLGAYGIVGASETLQNGVTVDATTTGTPLVTLGGGLVPASQANGDAANGTLFYSTTTSTLSFKGASGTVTDLEAAGGGGGGAVATQVFTDQAATPSAPSAGTLALYSRSVAGRTMPHFVGPTGAGTPVQAGLWGRQVQYATTQNATIHAQFGAAHTASGTVSHVSPAGVYPYMLNYVGTAATRGVSCVVQCYSRSKGFFFFGRVAYPDASYNQSGSDGSRVGFGLSSSLITMQFDNPNANGIASAAFMRQHVSTGRSDTNWQFTTTDGVAAQTVTDTGMPFAVGKVFTGYISCNPGGSAINWRIDNETDGTTASGSVSTSLPGSSTLLGHFAQVGSVGTVSRSMRMQILYSESDF
jgi:hypothetical protein